MRPQNAITADIARSMAALRWSKRGDVMPIPQKLDAAKQAARAAGLIKFTGSVCSHGHNGIRYVKSGQCVECVPMYRKLNKEKIQ